jgi:hypothetical protein
MDPRRIRIIFILAVLSVGEGLQTSASVEFATPM